MENSLWLMTINESNVMMMMMCVDDQNDADKYVYAYEHYWLLQFHCDLTA